ncbi:MAG: FAD-dependent oxidoreductase [Acidobacteria bacterium]|nr:FAD-dependent oxidoreductase [Acidobacteriota bacterium]
MSEKYDLIVIGGGSAGLVAAGGAGLLGARVALIEKNLLGGDCLYTGCVPSKSLIRSAKFASDTKRAAEFGFRIGDLGFANGSFASVTERVRNVIKAIEPHDSPERFKAMGVEVIFGTPRFLNAHEIEIQLKSGESRVLKAKRFCISTGSRAFVPPIEGLDEAGFVTNEDVFDLRKLPDRLVILGAGAIGVELGQAFARFGSRVTLIEMADRILIKEDEEVSRFMESHLRREGVEILTARKAVRVESEGAKTIILDDGTEIVCDEILAALGRRANVDGLDLEKAGVKYSQQRIETDDYLRTSAKHIFAAGDVTGHFQFTHTADYEAQIVLQNAFLFFPFTKKTDFRVIPWATFTEPEVARVGLTESEARAAHGDVKVIRVSFDDNDRAHAEGAIEGFAKVILKGKRIVGAHIVGLRAGELIHEFVLAMRHGLSLGDLNKAIHIYPTLSKITQALGTEETIETLQSPFVRKWLARYLKIWR